MGNLRNPDGYERSHWPWDWLNGAFGPKGKVSDLDGIEERNGRFLVFETKRVGEQVSPGQRILLNNLCNMRCSVLVLYGNPGQVEYAQWWGRDMVKADNAMVYQWCQQWWEWASKPYDPEIEGGWWPKDMNGNNLHLPGM